MSEKKKYVDAEIDMVRFEDMDIITTSGETGEPQGGTDDWGWA